MYNQQLVFTPGGHFAQNASTEIINDVIALEANEAVNLQLVFLSATFGVSLGHFPTTLVEIVDDDCKLTKTASNKVIYFVCFVTPCTFTSLM